MPNDLLLRPAEAPADATRLRAFVAAEEGGAAASRLDAHLARPRYRPAFTRLAERGGELVGYALVSHRRLRLGAATLEAGLLEHAFVQPAHRRQGIFRALMGEYLGMLYEQGIPFAALAGPPPLFAPFGFAPYLLSSLLRLDVVSATHDQRPTTNDQGLEDASGELASVVRRSSFVVRRPVEGDLEDLAALYEASYAALPLAELRTAPDWRAWLAAAGEALLLRDARGRAAAYALLAPDHPPQPPLVVEAGAADAGAARTLFAALLDIARVRGAPALELALAPEHPVARAGLHLGGELRVTAIPREGIVPLAGVVDLAGALTALAPEIERRLAASRYAGWGGSLRLELDTGRATLMFDAGRVSVVDGTRPANVRLRRVTLPALAQLLLGFRAAADLRATDGLDCDDTALGLIDALFPVIGACGGLNR